VASPGFVARRGKAGKSHETRHGALTVDFRAGAAAALRLIMQH